MRIVTILTAVVAFSFAIEACRVEPGPVTPESRPCKEMPDEEFPVFDSGTDEAKAKSIFLLACDNLRTLDCPEGDPPPKDDAGKPKRQSCTATLREGVELGISNIQPMCIIMAKSKDMVRKCNVRCLPR